MRSLSSLLLLATCVASYATNPYGRLVLHESAAHIPSDWRYHSPAEDHETLDLQIGLRQPDSPHLRVAEQVSEPSSTHYGRYLSVEELNALLPGVHDAAARVKSWLATHDIHAVDLRGEWLHFSPTVAQARRLFDADFARYRFRSEAPVLRTPAYSIPEDLLPDVDFVFPTAHFFGSSARDRSRTLVSRQHIPSGPRTCDNSTCPKQIRDLYKINYQPPTKSKSKLGVAGFLEQYASQDDLITFLKQYGLRNSTVPSYAPPYKFNVALVNGGKNPTASNASGVEAMLDLDYTMAFTEPLDVTYYSTGGRPPTLDEHGNKTVPAKDSQNEPFLPFLEYLLAQKEPPQVVSMSYSDNEQSVPIKYAQRVCDSLARLAARGVSVVGASGDGGASGTGNGDCIGPDGKKRFVPTFPSSCPWITSVGALASYGGAAAISRGGFSNYFGVPAWQKTATQGYIKALNGSHNGFYNKTGRGIPDITLLGDDFLIFQGGYASAHDGTSASTPVFAAMVALLNDLRLRAGKPVLGHLNPWLYSAGVRASLADIQDKSNINGCSDGSFFEVGFEALPGWDAASGLGSPDFSKLRKLI